ncbi:MAG: hypothetical protein JWN98_563 [Abditibacteriota bacterium]|nr:hypothetical protein [Abditibacteriota bacterium]
MPLTASRMSGRLTSNVKWPFCWCGEKHRRLCLNSSVNFLLSGYYGYRNAGDEAVLAAILHDLAQSAPRSTFTVTSGNPAYTTQLHSSHPIQAITRQSPRALAAAIGACDVFVSGGGSLLQDVTSLRNVVYYTSLLRFAQLSRKPTMIYAQGIGPLRRPLAQKLARIAIQRARVVTLRDLDSQALLKRIGVSRQTEVTADPVWNLSPAANNAAPQASRWCVSLRDWPGVEDDDALSRATFHALATAAHEAGAQLRFLPMQMEVDAPLVTKYLEGAPPVPHEIINTHALHPREIMARIGGCQVMIAMRLHALIFAAVQGVPCVALNYDPKVEALAKIAGAPLLSAHELRGDSGASTLQEAVCRAGAMDAAKLADLQNSARRNAELAAGLL